MGRSGSGSAVSRAQTGIDRIAGGSAVLVENSPVSGTGAYAGKFFPAGSLVLPLTGKRLHRSEFNTANYDLPVLQIDEDWFLLAEGQPDDFINHSCAPNLGFTPDGRHFFALRDIQPGEELFFDYSSSESDPAWTVPCLCGTSRCRGEITAFQRLDPAMREELAPIAMPYLRKRQRPDMR